jgi:hypothetical protein
MRLVLHPEVSSSAITIDIHLLDPDVDRSMAEYEECRLEWSWILIGTSGGGGRDCESVQERDGSLGERESELVEAEQAV